MTRRDLVRSTKRLLSRGRRGRPVIPEVLPNHADPLDYLDQTSIIVRRVRSLVPTPQPVEGFVCSFGGPMDVTLNDAARFVTAVAWNGNDDVMEPFIAQQRYTQSEWGASGYGVDFAVDVLENISADTVLLGLTYAIGKIRGKRTERVAEALPASAEELRDLVLNTTAQIFDADPDDLEVLEVSLSQNRSRLRLRSGDTEFAATVKILDGGERVVVVKRRH